MKNLKDKILQILNREINFKLNMLDLSIALKEAGLLLKSNINTSEMIRLLSITSPNNKLKNIFKKVYANLLLGFNLSESFEKLKIFDKLFLSLVKSGEVSENLSNVFLYLSNYYEKKYKLKQKIITIMIYPIILLFVTTVVLIFLLNNVVFMFLDIFTQGNIDLPFITILLINFVTFFKNYYLLIIFLILIFILFLKLIKRNYKVKLFFGKILFKIPYFKTHYQNYITSIVAKNLTILLKGNINIIESLNIIKDSMENAFVKKHLEFSIKSISKGNLISDSIKNDTIFNFAFISMLFVGENSENLVDILESATEYYEQKINYSVEKILQYLQPILIILISIFVSFIVFSIAIPIFDLSNGITIQ